MPMEQRASQFSDVKDHGINARYPGVLSTHKQTLHRAAGLTEVRMCHVCGPSFNLKPCHPFTMTTVHYETKYFVLVGASAMH